MPSTWRINIVRRRTSKLSLTYWLDNAMGIVALAAHAILVQMVGYIAGQMGAYILAQVVAFIQDHHQEVHLTIKDHGDHALLEQNLIRG